MKNYLGCDPGNGAMKAAGIDRTGRAEPVRSERGDKSFPSYVAITGEGKTLIGEDAWEHGLVYPSQVVTGWKFHLGDSSKRYFNGTKSAKDILTMVVSYVMGQAEKQFGMKVDGVVATCPANFTDAQKNGVLQGFNAAGIKVVQLVSEPAAAAFAYATKDNAGCGRQSWILCIDLGHGTLDVSVLKVDGGVATPAATEGVPQLGGRDYTEEVKKLLLDQVSKEAGKTITLDKLTPEQHAELTEKAEKAKHSLGNQKSTKVALNFSGKARMVEITQSAYETATAPLLKQMLDCVDRAMKSSGKTFKEMEKVVLAGAPFLSPLLQSKVADHTGCVPRIEIDPATVVSIGAAYLGESIARKEGGKGTLPDRPTQIREATGHDIGVAVVDKSSGVREMVCAVVVPKNTPVPTELTQHFHLERPSQTEVAIMILQGPDNSPAAKCAIIGELRLKNLPPESVCSERIKVTFKFDSNTLVTVTATDIISGKSNTVSVKL